MELISLYADQCVGHNFFAASCFLTSREKCRALEGLQPAGENEVMYVRAVSGDTQIHREVTEGDSDS